MNIIPSFKNKIIIVFKAYLRKDKKENGVSSNGKAKNGVINGIVKEKKKTK